MRRASLKKTDPSGKIYSCLTIAALSELERVSGLSRRALEIKALEEGIIPARYERNLGTIGTGGQLKLLKARVGLVGAGGLGGLAAELLARMGVGSLVVIDDDVFADSNLNRQLLAQETNLNCPKAEEAGRRINVVNSAVEVVTHVKRGHAKNLPHLLGGCALALDCLDNLPSRFDLEEACQGLGIPLIHAAIAGLIGQLAVIRPGGPLLSAIYGPESKESAQKGAELKLGIPAATASMLAAWQVSEAVKYLTGSGDLLPAGKMLMVDLAAGESYQLELQP